MESPRALPLPLPLLAPLLMLLPLLAPLAPAVAAPSSAPHVFDRCPTRKQPDFDQCVLKEANKVMQHLKNGLPRYRIPAIDPFQVPEMAIDHAGLKIVFTEPVLEGLGDIKITNISINTASEPWSLVCQTFVPRMALKGQYQVDGKLLVFQIKGSGNCINNFEGVTGEFHAKLERTKGKGGMEYFRLVDPDVKIAVEKFSCYYDNLFDGDKALGETANALLNENSRALMEEFEGPIRESVLSISMPIVGKALKLVPVADVMPPA